MGKAESDPATQHGTDQDVTWIMKAKKNARQTDQDSDDQVNVAETRQPDKQDTPSSKGRHGVPGWKGEFVRRRHHAGQCLPRLERARPADHVFDTHEQQDRRSDSQ